MTCLFPPPQKKQKQKTKEKKKTCTECATRIHKFEEKFE